MANILSSIFYDGKEYVIKDYTDDINNINERIDEIETKEVTYDDTEIKEEISTLKADIEDINSDININHDKEKISSYTFTITDYIDDGRDYGVISLCLPFDFELPDGLKFVSLFLEENEGTLNQYNYGYYTSTSGRAHTPYIIGGKPGTYTVSGEYVEPFDNLTYLKTRNLRGTYKTIEVKASLYSPIYYVASGKIWKANKPTIINPYRAYVLTNDNQEWLYDSSLDEHSTNAVQNKYIKREFEADRERIAQKVDKTELETKLNTFKVEIDKEIVSAVTDGKVDLDGYATERWVENKHYITGVDLTDYATIEYVDALGNNVVSNTNSIAELSGKCEDFITLDDVQTIQGEKGEKGDKGDKGDSGYTPVKGVDYFTNSEIEEIANSAYTKVYNDNRIAKKTDLDALSGTVSTINRTYATTSYVSESIAQAKLDGSDVDLSQYALREEIPNDISELNNDAGYLTENELSDYLTKTSADTIYQPKGNYLTSIPFTYAQKSDIPTNVGAFYNDKGYLTQHQSLDGYATTGYVNTQIAQAQLDGSDVDLSGYLTKESGDTLYQPKGTYLTSVPDTYAKKTDIPTIPTKVSAFENDKGYLTQHQSLANYALKSEIPTVPANIMTESNYETIDVVGTKADGSTITYKFLVKK